MSRPGEREEVGTYWDDYFAESRHQMHAYYEKAQEASAPCKRTSRSSPRYVLGGDTVWSSLKQEGYGDTRERAEVPIVHQTQSPPCSSPAFGPLPILLIGTF